MGEKWVGIVVGIAVVVGEGVGGEKIERMVLGVCLRERGRTMRVHEGNIQCSIHRLDSPTLVARHLSSAEFIVQPTV